MDINRILCPVDFSDCSDAALAYASKLASKWGASLDIVHVDENPPQMAAGVSGYGYAPSAEPYRQLSDREWLDRVSPTEPGVEFQRHYLRGPTANSLLNFAGRKGVDLIVIGSHGRTGVSRALLGSVAESVMRHAALPVLVVKSPHAGKAEDASASNQQEGAVR